MIAIVRNETLVIFRRTSAGLRHLATIHGAHRHADALEAARAARLFGLAAGEWREPDFLALDSLDPIPGIRIVACPFREHGIDCGG